MPPAFSIFDFAVSLNLSASILIFILISPDPRTLTFNLLGFFAFNKNFLKSIDLDESSFFASINLMILSRLIATFFSLLYKELKLELIQLVYTYNIYS